VNCKRMERIEYWDTHEQKTLLSSIPSILMGEIFDLNPADIFRSSSAVYISTSLERGMGESTPSGEARSS